MSLFQSSVLKKYINNQDSIAVGEAYEQFKSYFHNPAIQENIRQSKEEQFQEGFLRELFVKILGYTLNPNDNYNLTTELKNEKGAKKTDGAILKNGKALGVIELKGTDTKDLDKVNDQAFSYKNHHSDCVYVITSNFEKLRFFIHNAVDHIEFNLFQLSKEDFKVLWLCLQADNILGGIPLKANEESILQEENITKQLYKDYSGFKHQVWQNICKNSPQDDPLLLFKKTQKLLDRFLFIFFAEDSGLLPPNSISRMVDRYEKLIEMDAYKPLYNIFKQYFGYINIGRKGKARQDDIFEYNGGLFRADEILDNIQIDDEVLKPHVLKMTEYDFQSEIDVNILGHIFENSLNDIENVTAELEGQEIDKSKTKRKKDGVFYTPKYITKYIVENTVGRLCEEKKAVLKIEDEEYAKGRRNRNKSTIKKLDEKLQAYRNWLLNITICDPACGSGAFLNQALEFLIAEHQFIDELETQLLGHDFEFPGIEAQILEKNIFGVDINEESIEIAKLSLWLRTAQRGRKLTSLSNNIKCGNSLIDDSEVAREKAFSWQKEFPKIFTEKELEAFHIVLTTHNSRVSERMRQRNIKKGPAINLNLEEEIALTEIFREIITENNYRCISYNICKDHVHMILVCARNELQGIVQKLKSVSSRSFHQLDIPMGHYPLEHNNHLWSQKFFYADLDIWTFDHKGYNFRDEYIDRAREYIKANRIKHELPASKKLENIIDTFIIDQEEAFKPQYIGGFDVVIGNPPYVKLEKIKDVSAALEKVNYQTFDKRGDLYVLFVEKGFQLLKQNGLISYIMPNKWLQAGYGKKLREFLLTKQLERLIDFGDIQIFEGATTYPVIFIARENSPQKTFLAALLKETVKQDFESNVAINSHEFTTEEFSGDTWVISSGEDNKLLNRIGNKFPPLKEFVKGEALRGVLTGLSKAFIIDEETKQSILSVDPDASIFIKPFLQGRDIKRYIPALSLNYMIIIEKGFTKSAIGNTDVSEQKAWEWFEHKYPGISNWLSTFSEKARKRTDKGDFWWELRACDYYNEFAKPKIMYQVFQVTPCFIYDEQGLYCNNSMWILPTDNKALLGILNSKMGWWLITKYCTQIQNGYQLIWKYFGQIPIPDVSDSKLEPLVNEMMRQKAEFNKLETSFSTLLQSKFSIEKLSKKLQNWHELEFGAFLKELEKARKKAAKEQEQEYKKLSLSEEAEWMEYFNAQKAKAEELQSQINQTDKEIDQMVYELYGLSEEEIDIVESNSNSTNGA